VIVRYIDERSLGPIIQELGMSRPRPVLIVVGSADSLPPELKPAIARLFTDAIFPVCRARGAAIVDGGTDSGVMRVAGRARRGAYDDVPLIGVVAEGTTTWGGSDLPSAAPLEPNHSHALLVPGQAWGDESPWIPRVAAALAGREPMAAIVVGGGDVTDEDVQNIAHSDTSVIAVRNTGGTADRLWARTPDARIVLVDALERPEALSAALTQLIVPA
jgi:hypothetical protein